MSVRVLDGFELLIGGSRVQVAIRAQELIVWLSTHPCRTFTRAALLDHLTSDGLKDPVATLRGTLFGVRHAIKAAGGLSEEFISEDDARLALGPRVEVDLSVERTRWANACQLIAASDLVAEYRACDVPVSLTAFASFNWDWIGSVVEEIERERRTYLLAVARAACQIGSWELASQVARALIAIDPLCQEAVFIGIRAELSAGNIGGASDLYRGLEAALDYETGALPILSFDELLSSTARPRTVAPTAQQGVRPQREKPRPTVLAWAGGLFATVAAAALWFGTWAARPHDVPRNEEEALEQIALGSKSPGSLEAQHDRAQACAWIAENAYVDLFGPNEAHWKDLFERAGGGFEEAFYWSLSHEPDTALRIIGNGHRYLAMVEVDERWKRMLDQAIAANPQGRSAGFGRALFGVAFAHWHDQPKRGFACAARAADLFKGISPRDYGAAIRHMGLCCDSEHEAYRRQLYHQAMDVLGRADDAAGVAMCLQSLSETHYDLRVGSDAREALEWSLKAVDAFRAVHNERLVRYEMAYVDRFLSWLPSTPGTRSLRAEAHRTLLTQVAVNTAVGDQDAALLCLCSAMKAAVRLADARLIFSDLETFLRTDNGSYRFTDRPYMMGGYFALCRKLHRAPVFNPQTAEIGFSKRELREFDAGTTASLDDLSLAMTRDLSPVVRT